MHRCAVSSVSATSRRRCGCARSRRSYCSMARLPKSNSLSPRRNLPPRCVPPCGASQEPSENGARCSYATAATRQPAPGQRRIALCQQIQYGECPVQGLNFVDALRGCLSHDGPLFRAMISSQVCRIWDDMSNSWYGIAGVGIPVQRLHFEVERGLFAFPRTSLLKTLMSTFLSPITETSSG